MNIVKTRMTMTQATLALYQGFYKFSTPFEWLKKYQCTEGLKFLLFSLKVDTRRISTSRYINFALM